MFGAELDNLEGLDRVNNKHLDIDVLYPRTHIKKGRAQFTDYEIQVRTNHPEFALKDSRVRRRYSEFCWLKQRLGFNDVMMVTPPGLPGKRFIGKFKDSFLHKRQKGLQNFLNKLVEVSAFLHEPALHLFLQSTLPLSEMEYHLHHYSHLSNIRDVIIQSNAAKQRKERKHLQLSRPVTGKLKRSLSLNSLPAASKELKKNSHGSGGRGWSRYIGDGYFSWSVGLFDSVDYPGGLFGFRPRSVTTAACVLPGGKLSLPTDPLPVMEKMPRKHRPLSASWHGNMHDLVDFVLDDYEVITSHSVKMSCSDIESMSTSETSRTEMLESASTESSDDGIEIDISERLKEYNIITLPTQNCRH